ncbi:MAG TPA: SAM-dependent methyltransferase, partial [Firmicutes bacterium]|nr:SAM-dependent methyltransferase [Bacillota bacterium]
MSSDVLNDAETHRLGLGKLRMIQQQEIFKFTVDPLLLAAFLPIRPQELVLDLGTGTGVLPLWLTG